MQGLSHGLRLLHGEEQGLQPVLAAPSPATRGPGHRALEARPRWAPTAISTISRGSIALTADTPQLRGWALGLQEQVNYCNWERCCRPRKGALGHPVQSTRRPHRLLGTWRVQHGELQRHSGCAHGLTVTPRGMRRRKGLDWLVASG